MKREEALKLRDEYRPKLIGTPFQIVGPGWDIKDIIISDRANAGLVYEKMWQEEITNEQALLFFEKTDDYEVYIISHQWPWGSGNIFTRTLKKFLESDHL